MGKKNRVKGKARTSLPAFVKRPFEGLPSECDVIALRELVPAGTAPLALAGSDREVVLCSLLPMAAPAMVRESGAIWLGLQVQHHFGDPARDLGAVLEKAIAQAEAGEVGIVGLTDPPGEGPRLQDLVTGDSLDVTVHEGFDFWLSDVEDKDAMAGALDQANEAAMPTSRLSSVEAAYWTSIGTKEHLRWVMPQPEDALLAALARSAGRPLSRAQLIDRALGRDAEVTDRAIDVQIGRLRKAIGDDAANPRFIRTIWGVGYVLAPGTDA